MPRISRFGRWGVNRRTAHAAAVREDAPAPSGSDCEECSRPALRLCPTCARALCATCVLGGALVCRPPDVDAELERADREIDALKEAQG